MECITKRINKMSISHLLTDKMDTSHFLTDKIKRLSLYEDPTEACERLDIEILKTYAEIRLCTNKNELAGLRFHLDALNEELDKNINKIINNF